MHDMDFRERGSASVWVLLFAAAMCVMPLPGQAQIIQKIVAAKQGRAIENALAEGKSVLVARETVFNPLVGFQPGSIFGGDYRPPLTYWLHRDTQSQLVLGSSSAKEGRGRLSTEIGRASGRERVCQ